MSGLAYVRDPRLSTWYAIIYCGKKIGMVKRKRIGGGRFAWAAEDNGYWFYVTGAKTRKAAARALLILLGKS